MKITPTPSPPVGTSTIGIGVSASNGDVLTWDATTSTWVASPASPLMTKGDLWGFDTADARVPVGADGKVLTADRGAALGVSYQTPSAIGPQHVHVDNVTYSGDAATTVFYLSAAPVDAYSIGVYVGTGRNNDWTLSGAMLDVLTFGAAPAAGTNNISIDIAATL